jgi:hypothetical protein
MGLTLLFEFVLMCHDRQIVLRCRRRTLVGRRRGRWQVRRLDRDAALVEIQHVFAAATAWTMFWNGQDQSFETA